MSASCHRTRLRLNPQAQAPLTLRGSAAVNSNGVLARFEGRLLGGRYEIRHAIGMGGSAVVFAAEDRLRGDLAAVKLLMSPPHLTLDVSRFHLEVKIAQQLCHPHLVAVRDAGVEGDETAFLVMDLLQGQTLAALLQQRQRLDAATTVSLLLPILHAVEHAHGHGVLHRDIKPDNIYLSECSTRGLVVPKLLDFGIAKHAEDRALTRAGSVLGTPAYMSPEQALGEPLGCATDVWSLGVVLFECLTGRLPFEAPTDTALLLKTVSSDAPSLRVMAPDVPRHVAWAVDQALCREPARRYTSLGAFAHALERAAALDTAESTERPEPRATRRFG